MSVSHRPRFSVTHATHGRLRLKIHARHGGGHLDFVAGLLQRLPHVDTVRVNQHSRSVALTFDPRYVTGPILVERLCRLGLTAVEITEPVGWVPLVVERLAPRVKNPATLSGRAHQKLLAASGGRLNLVRVVAGLLVLAALLDGRAALVRGVGLPWVRLLTYLSVAASLWAGSHTAESAAAPLKASH
jgi:hypothetical protein